VTIRRELQVGAERCDEELRRQFVVLLVGCVRFDCYGHALQAFNESAEEWGKGMVRERG
jgi:hypothetical protein